MLLLFALITSGLCFYILLTQASDGSLARRSAASMLSGKKPVSTAVSISFWCNIFITLCFYFLLVFAMISPGYLMSVLSPELYAFS